MKGRFDLFLCGWFASLALTQALEHHWVFAMANALIAWLLFELHESKAQR